MDYVLMRLESFSHEEEKKLMWESSLHVTHCDQHTLLPTWVIRLAKLVSFYEAIGHLLWLSGPRVYSLPLTMRP